MSHVEFKAPNPDNRQTKIREAISACEIVGEVYCSDGHSPSPPWWTYGKTSDMINPLPCSLWVMIDENPDSVNDAAFAVKMDYQGRATLWQDGPATYHCGGCGFNFADGHSGIKKWRDPRTTSPPMVPTYRLTFPNGTQQPNNPDIQWVQDRTSAGMKP